jgi:hypothetical protein
MWTRLNIGSFLIIIALFQSVEERDYPGHKEFDLEFVEKTTNQMAI